MATQIMGGRSPPENDDNEWGGVDDNPYTLGYRFIGGSKLGYEQNRNVLEIHIDPGDANNDPIRLAISLGDGEPSAECVWLSQRDAIEMMDLLGRALAMARDMKDATADWAASNES